MSSVICNWGWWQVKKRAAYNLIPLFVTRPRSVSAQGWRSTRLGGVSAQGWQGSGFWVLGSWLRGKPDSIICVYWFEDDVHVRDVVEVVPTKIQKFGDAGRSK